MEPIFDEADLLDRLGGDAELVGEVIVAFLDDAAARQQEIEAALAADDAAALRQAAHSLKGAAGSLGAPRLQASAFSVEMAAQQSVAAGRAIVAALVADLHELTSVLRRRDGVAQN